MSESPRPLLSDLQEEVDRLRRQMGDLVAARWELAALEMGAAMADIRRLGIRLAVAALLVLWGTPVLVVGLAEVAAAYFDTARAPWLVGIGVAALALGMLIAGCGVRRFRREFVGLEETLEEFTEDVAWLRELTPQAEAAERETRGEAAKPHTANMQSATSDDTPPGD